MRKMVVLLLSCLMVVCLLSTCGKKKVEAVYYSNTNVPTFTCVTNIEGEKSDAIGDFSMYQYECEQKDADKYVDYLKENGFVKVEAEDDYDGLYTYAKGNDARVLVDYCQIDKGIFTVLPYFSK